MELRHTKLVAWQRADDLVILIHQLTEAFPARERFELVSQLRRAAFSVAANIVEGYARRGERDRLRFLNIAESSLAELGYGIHVATRLGYVTPSKSNEVDHAIRRVAVPLVGLIRSINAAGHNSDESK